MLLVLEVVVALCVLAFLAVVFYAHCIVKTDNPQILSEQRTELKMLRMSDKVAEFSTEFDLKNFGPELCTISDLVVNPLLPHEQYDLATAYAFIEKASDRRHDNYFVATLVERGESIHLILTIHLVANEGYTIDEAIDKMVDMDTCIYYCGSGRKELYLRRHFVRLLAEEFKAARGGEKA